jgi:hypothetical protein
MHLFYLKIRFCNDLLFTQRNHVRPNLSHVIIIILTYSLFCIISLCTIENTLFYKNIEMSYIFNRKICDDLKKLSNQVNTLELTNLVTFRLIGWLFIFNYNMPCLFFYFYFVFSEDVSYFFSLTATIGNY